MSDNIFCNVELMSPEDFAKVVAQIDFVKQWVASVESKAAEMAGEGKLPGFKLVAGNNLRSWADEDKAIKLLTTAGYDEEMLYKPQEMITVAQAEKLVGKKAFAPMQETLVAIRSGKSKLVTEDHPKPALVTSAASDFEKVKP